MHIRAVESWTPDLFGREQKDLQGVFMFLKKNMKVRKAKISFLQETEKVRSKQVAIGNKLYKELRKTVNEHDPTLMVGKRENNGMSNGMSYSSYSITIGIPDNKLLTDSYIFDEEGGVVRGIQAFFVSINLSQVGNEICMVSGVYGIDEIYSINHLKEFTTYICSKVRTYRRYPE